mgnify:FL=1
MQQFRESQYKIVDFEEIADVYVINTCTVTNISDKKSRQMIRRAKQRNKNSIIVAVGCYAQVAEEELKKMPEIDIILGNNEKKDIVSIINKYSIDKDEEKISSVMEQKEFIDFESVAYSDKVRAVIKVQDGCDRFCSYCIIPYARGRVRSRTVSSIIDEIKAFVDKGIKEVVITGIHVASYGRDFKEKTELIDLLEEINKIDGLERIRLSSLEPTIITEEFVKRLSKLEKICNHFHLSLQSACNETLKRMNRHYTIEEFKNSVDLLRKNYKNVALTTDVIVGFPGETDEEFEECYRQLKEIRFYKLHVFKYSQRKGTKAASMENQVAPNIKEERSKKLIALSEQYEQEFNKELIGNQEKVLWEQVEGEFFKGHTTNYIIVYTMKNQARENEITNVKFIELKKDGIFGEVIKM